MAGFSHIYFVRTDTMISLSSDRRTLRQFYLITALVCGGGIFVRWLSRGQWNAAIIRTGIFLVAMAIVHVVGYYAYARQCLLPKERSRISSTLASSAKFNLVWQLLVLLLASMLLDGGAVLGLCQLASAGYWAGVGLIALRRPRVQSAGDAAFLHAGWPLLAVVAALLTFVVPRLADGR